MKQILKKIISLFYPSVYKKGVLVLNYHSVSPFGGFSLSPEKFEEQISFISKNFNAIEIDRIPDNLHLKSPAVVVTFDDGYEDNFLYAFPILKKYQVKATIFITSDFVFSNLDITSKWKDYVGLKPLSQSQIDEMLKSGIIKIGSHSKTHPKFSSLLYGDAIEELQDSKKDIEEKIGVPIDSFAYPFGQNKDIGNIPDDFLKESGYNFVFTTNWGININKGFNPFRINRIRIDHNDTMSDFKNKIKGKWDFVRFFQKIKNI